MNSVGSNSLNMFPEVDVDSWNYIVQINVTATVRRIQTCAPLIKESGGGAMVLIASVARITGNFSTRRLRLQVGARGCLPICGLRLRRLGHRLQRHPTRLHRARHDRQDQLQPNHEEDDRPHHEQENPAPRTGKAEEIASTALFLASDDSAYITGTDIVVDGGWFSSAPYLGNERSHHMLTLLKKKDQFQEFVHHFH
jgi:NAD(P)-dependent dehydrogenase (short-subunit alcohol dehydrogenase family)